MRREITILIDYDKAFRLQVNDVEKAIVEWFVWIVRRYCVTSRPKTFFKLKELILAILNASAKDKGSQEEDAWVDGFFDSDVVEPKLVGHLRKLIKQWLSPYRLSPLDFGDLPRNYDILPAILDELCATFFDIQDALSEAILASDISPNAEVIDVAFDWQAGEKVVLEAYLIVDEEEENQNDNQKQPASDCS